MASKTSPVNRRDKQYSDPDDKSLFTLEGYTKIFQKCEKRSEIYEPLSKIINEMDVDVWKDYLSTENMLKSVDGLFLYWTDLQKKNQLVNKDDYIKFIEIFSLLENVFRNVLLRPYIPAYRTINMYSGRYRSFVSSSEKNLFGLLDFIYTSENLLTYQELDPEKTILYAITSYVFWHVLSMKLDPKFPRTS